MTHVAIFFFFWFKTCECFSDAPLDMTEPGQQWKNRLRSGER